MRGNHVIDACEAVRGCVATDSLVFDTIAITVLIEQILQVIRITSSRYSSGQTVAKRHNYRPVIGLIRFIGGLRWCWHRSCGTRRCFCALFFLGAVFLVAFGAATASRQPQGAGEAGCNNEDKAYSSHTSKLTWTLPPASAT